MEFNPLSLNTSLGFPLCVIKCLKVREKTSLVKPEANSTWIAHRVKHVMISTYFVAVA